MCAKLTFFVLFGMTLEAGGFVHLNHGENFMNGMIKICLGALMLSFSAYGSFDMEFVRIDEGGFIMGSPANEASRDDDEGQVAVFISHSFEIGKYEVTQRQWFEVMEDNPSYFRKFEHCANSHMTIGVVEMCPDHPVEQVSWNDIQDFLIKLNDREGVSGCGGEDHYNMPSGCHRLPTEAEWEYAARGGTGGAYFFGNNPADLDDYGWYSSNSGRKTHPVGMKGANPLGLHDVFGNVWEWVQDSYADTLPGGKNPLQTDGSDIRILRGGSWYYGARLLRSATRNYGDFGTRGNSAGFRIVRSL